jgi:hypothetical protein
MTQMVIDRRIGGGMHQGRSTHRIAVLATALALVTVACGKSATTQPTSPPTSMPPTTTPVATSVYDVSLKGICPDKIVLQTDWFPEPEHGAAYNLIGPGGKIDVNAGTYTGPLRDTGVELEIRAGGPFIGFQQPVAQMYSDEAILLGYADTGDQIRQSGKLPTVAIVAPLEKGPQVLMFDPAAHDFQTFADVGKSGARVLYFEGDVAIAYAVYKGYLKESQLDASYDGSPARFITDDGKDVVEAFATNEPYKWEHNIPEWGKRLDFMLFYDAGFTVYQSNVVVRPETITKYPDCLAKLVPMWQQSEIDFVRNPQSVSEELLKIVEEFASFWTLSPDGNADAVQKMLDLGLVSNGPDGTLGNFDLSRVQQLIDTLLPMFEEQKLTSVREGVKAEDIVTNEFIDPSIGL